MQGVPGFGEEVGGGGPSMASLLWAGKSRRPAAGARVAALARPSAAPRRRLPLIAPRLVQFGRVLGRGAGLFFISPCLVAENHQFMIHIPDLCL